MESDNLSLKNRYLVICNDSPGLGGSEKSMLRVMDILKDSCKLKFCLSKHVHSAVKDVISKSEFDYEYFDIPASAPNFLKGLIQARRLVKKHKNQVFIIWCHNPDSNRWLQLWLAFSGAKFILVERSVPAGKGDFNHSKLSIPIKGYVIRRAISVVLCGWSQINHYQNIFGQPKRLNIIPNSRPVEELNKQSSELRKTTTKLIDMKGKVICCVGRLDPNKGQLNLINAFAKISDKYECSLLLVGEGNYEYEQTLKQQVQSLNLTQVFFTGYSTEVNKWLALSDIFVLNSLFEGLPGALIEAMAVGVPCIASDIPGSRELVIHNETGLLVPVSNEDALVLAIETYLNNPEMAKQFAVNAYKKVLADYSIETEKKKWIELVDELLKS